MLAVRKGKPLEKIIQENTWQSNSRAAKELGWVVATYAIYNLNVTLWNKVYSFKASVCAEPWKSWLTKQADAGTRDILQQLLRVDDVSHIPLRRCFWNDPTASHRLWNVVGIRQSLTLSIFPRKSAHELCQHQCSAICSRTNILLVYI